MVACVSSDELLQSLIRSGLLSADEIARAEVAATKSAGDVQSFATALVSQGILTTYQAESVRAGKSAELKIGNYDVFDRIGAGGMGTVFKARHRRMKRIVALKILPRSLAEDDSLVRRFQREVETIARLSHPNIVMAFDADEDSHSGHFLVMEYVDGHDLATLVKKQGPFSLSAAVNCVLQAARGLECSHAQGIIHRDIKPANLLFDSLGVVKVTDLGLARFANTSLLGNAETAALSGITQAGGILGTVDYMPPEQAFGTGEIDHRADIYSLGATLHFLLLGEPPYIGQNLMATLLKHREAPIPSLLETRKDVPLELDALFRQMLAKAPGDRVQSMTEVVRALEAIETQYGVNPGTPSPSEDSFHAPSATEQTVIWDVRDLEPPSSLCASTQVMERSAAGHSTGLPAKVLLVEPSRTLSGIFRRSLQAQGIEQVLVVATGREALEVVRSDHPGAVVSALHLSDMTGVQLGQQIRSQECTRAPGFVLVSSEAENAELGSLSAVGGAAVLQKPFTPEKLIEAVRMVTSAPAVSTTTRDHSTLRVLIVDDSGPARSHVRAVLQSLGVTNFVEAADGAQAVAKVAQGGFDLIVTDYNMPYMDGGGLVGYLRQNPSTASVKIIMVTSEEDPTKLQAVRRLGVAAVCGKSFPVQIVGPIVDELVRMP